LADSDDIIADGDDIVAALQEAMDPGAHKVHVPEVVTPPRALCPGCEEGGTPHRDPTTKRVNKGHKLNLTGVPPVPKLEEAGEPEAGWAPPGPCPGCEAGLTPHFGEDGRFLPGHNRPHPAGLTPGSRGYAKWLATEALEEALPRAAGILIKNLDSALPWVRHAAAKEIVERGIPKEVTLSQDAFAGPAIVFPPGTSMAILAGPVSVRAQHGVSRRPPGDQRGDE